MLSVQEVSRMPAGTHGEAPVTTIDVTELDTLMWGPLRAMFPSFVEEIELGRYLRRVLERRQCKAVQVERHIDASGQPSTHIFDVFFVNEPTQVD
jgi:hypothetical protein